MFGLRLAGICGCDGACVLGAIHIVSFHDCARQKDSFKVRPLVVRKLRVGYAKVHSWQEDSTYEGTSSMNSCVMYKLTAEKVRFDC